MKMMKTTVQKVITVQNTFVSIYFHRDFTMGNVKIKLYHESERLTCLSDISLFKFNKNKSYIK